MLRHLCNSCKRELSPEELDASRTVAREFIVRFKQFCLVPLTDRDEDLFCSADLQYAEDYWIDKVQVLEKLSATSSSTLRNHCRDFFKKAKHESETLPRALEQVAARS